MKYIDMHCDTLSIGLAQHKETITKLEKSMVDIDRLHQARTGAQFFAMFVPQRDVPKWYDLEKMPEHETLLDMMSDIFWKTIKENANRMAFAQSSQKMHENLRAGKMSAFLTMENGFAVRGKMENLKKFHDMGVGLMTLTWNDPNCFGQNHSSDKALMQTGLTDFGKEAIPYMNELGMIVDVSHLSDGGFYDVAEISKKPFVASHSNCRELSPSTRNLTDDMIRLLADKGGVAGINFEPTFLNWNQEDIHSRVSRMCDHVEHFIKVGGEECVGIGTDFDGIGGQFEISDCTKMNLFFEELQRRKISDAIIDKIAYGNVTRVIKDSMKPGNVQR